MDERNTNELVGQRIAVTGGAGFIGSHLVDRLLEMGNSVTVLDNFSSGKRDFISHHEDNERFTLIEMDLLDGEAVGRVLKDFDWVFHLAANPDVRLGASDTYVHLEQNVIVTYNILEAMRNNRIDKIAFTSTSTVYGEANTIPTPEDYGPMVPISLYASSKLASEGFITAYCSNFDMRSYIFRFANVVGPRSTHGVIYDFYHKLRKDSTNLEILGREPGTRKSYFYITDCIEGMIFSCRNSFEMANIFNIGSRDHITVKTLADAVCEAVGLDDVKYRWTGGVDGGRGWKGDVKVMLLAIEKLRSMGFSPKYDSRTAVVMTTRALME